MIKSVQLCDRHISLRIILLAVCTHTSHKSLQKPLCQTRAPVKKRGRGSYDWVISFLLINARAPPVISLNDHGNYH